MSNEEKTKLFITVDMKVNDDYESISCPIGLSIPLESLTDIEFEIDNLYEIILKKHTEKMFELVNLVQARRNKNHSQYQYYIENAPESVKKRAKAIVAKITEEGGDHE